MPDKYQDTPLHVAAKNGRLAVVELLLEFGADLALQNKHGKTPFQWAEDFNEPEVAACLALAGGNPALPNKLPPEISAQLAEDLLLSVDQVT